MEPRSLGYVDTACAGDLRDGAHEALVHRVCTDSRQAQPGDLFFALAGERFDGHDYLPQAVAKGVGAVVAERSRLPAGKCGCPVIAVESTRQALGRLAARYREDFSLPVVAVGGSNGKTTTKELVAAVLRQQFPTLWSEASFNNDIGVPLTLLRLDSSHRAAVLEVGSNHPGELAPLVQIIRPNYGIITSIGREHLEFFGDLAGVAREEGWLAELLPVNGRLLVNGEREWASLLAKRTRAPAVRVGLGAGQDWRARDLCSDERGIRFLAEGPRADFAGEYRIRLLGRHQVVNALFAIAMGAELGMEREAVAQGLAKCQPLKMRLELWEAGGLSVLDDSYNANADSMEAALHTLQELPCKGRRVAVLGDMAELGAYSSTAHEEAGRRVAELGIGQLFAIGTMAPIMARAAREAGLHRVFEFADVETAAAAVGSFVKSGDLVLLKASRAARLERIGDRLRNRPAAKGN